MLSWQVNHERRGTKSPPKSPEVPRGPLSKETSVRPAFSRLGTNSETLNKAWGTIGPIVKKLSGARWGQNDQNTADAARDALCTCASQGFLVSLTCLSEWIHANRQEHIGESNYGFRAKAESRRQRLQQHSANRKILYTLIYGVVDFARPLLAAGSPVQCQKNWVVGPLLDPERCCPAPSAF